MLENPGKEIYEVIRYFGERKKIFNVHFRNITGGFGDFEETFIDVSYTHLTLPTIYSV